MNLIDVLPDIHGGYLYDGRRRSWCLSTTLPGFRHSARRLVAFLKPRLFQVSARSPVKFLWLYESMIEAMARRCGGHKEELAYRLTPGHLRS